MEKKHCWYIYSLYLTSAGLGITESASKKATSWLKTWRVSGHFPLEEERVFKKKTFLQRTDHWWAEAWLDGVDRVHCGERGEGARLCDNWCWWGWALLGCECLWLKISSPKKRLQAVEYLCHPMVDKQKMGKEKSCYSQVFIEFCIF